MFGESVARRLASVQEDAAWGRAQMTMAPSSLEDLNSSFPCWRCDRPSDRIQLDENIMRRSMLVTFRCHSEMDRREVSMGPGRTWLVALVEHLRGQAPFEVFDTAGLGEPLRCCGHRRAQHDPVTGGCP